MGQTRWGARRAVVVTGALLSGVLVATAGPVVAAPGDLDPSFGTGGKVWTDAGGGDSMVNALALQPDGRILVAGLGFDADLARYNGNGALDPSFGTGGKVLTDFAGWANAVVLQPDGRILVAGEGSDVPGSVDIALARYNGSGALDPSFGTGGKVLTGLGGGAEANAMVLQPDGQIVVAGWAYGANGKGCFALARFNENGALDLSFGSGGKVLTDFRAGYAGADAMVLQPDGRILVAGGGFDADGDGVFALARYKTDGALDPSFGTGGKVLTGFGGDASANAMALQPDGQIVVAGEVFNSNVDQDFQEFALARYNGNGALDPSFGAGGRVLTGFGGGFGASAIVLQPDGQIVVAGHATGPLGPGGFALARYHGNGVLDLSFGTGGKVLTDFGRSDRFAVGANTMALQSDGQIVVAGEGFDADGNGGFALARYQGDGAP